MEMKFAILCLVTLVISTVSTATIEQQDEPSGRIVGGQVMHISQAPYNVQLRRVRGHTFCGGSLISECYVLTAAHCVTGETVNNLVVVGGANLMNDAGVQRRVERITIHPEYSSYTMHSDAAAIKLRQALTGPNIKPINLCSSPPKTGDIISVTGWGSLYDDGPMSNKMRHVTFPITSQQSCANEFHDNVEKNMFCGAGYALKGHCFGDSGGPGVVRGEVCGINSFGRRCGGLGYQSAFTDVYAVRDFINSAMKA